MSVLSDFRGERFFVSLHQPDGHAGHVDVLDLWHVRGNRLERLPEVRRLSGYHGDAARTFKIGNVSEEKSRLVKVTEECFFNAVRHVKDGTPLGDIGFYVQSHAEENGFSVVRALVGHGIGSKMHEDPSVPNYGKKGTGIRLKKGMTIAVEPMINAGVFQVEFMHDGWTCKTKDRRPSAHYENTILITENGAEILTL